MLANQAGQAFEHVLTRVGEIARPIEGIAMGAREQAAGLGKINAGVTDPDQVTQQNAAMVKEATAVGFPFRRVPKGLPQGCPVPDLVGLGGPSGRNARPVADPRRTVFVGFSRARGRATEGPEGRWRRLAGFPTGLSQPSDVAVAAPRSDRPDGDLAGPACEDAGQVSCQAAPSRQRLRPVSGKGIVPLSGEGMTGLDGPRKPTGPTFAAS